MEFSIPMHEGQRRLWDAWLGASWSPFVAEVAARWGKSSFGVGLSIHTGLRIKNGFIRYAAPTQKMVKTIITPLIRERTESMPKHARPRYSHADGCWHFPTTGAELWIAGCDNGNAENLRGVTTHLYVVDEAGFVDELDYVVGSILQPRTISVHGRGLVLSTPPKSPSHPFVFMAEKARERGAYYHGTIHEATHISDAQIVTHCEQAGGAQSNAWRREYLAERVIDTTLAVVPEFVEHEQHVVREWPEPPFADRYVSMDPGFTDLTAAVLAYWDFKEGVLVVEDEVAVERGNTTEIAAALKEREAERWPGKEPHLRVSDVDLRLLHELHLHHGLTFVPTAKDDKDVALNALRVAVAGHKIVIHPRCRQVVSHLRTAIWNKARTGYERAAGFGHFDFVDALVYLVRNVQQSRNPYPAHWHGETHQTHWMRPANDNATATGRTLREAFANRIRRAS